MVLSRKYRRRIFSLAAFCFLPLLLGGAMYLLLRSDSLLVFRWIEWLGYKNELEQLRKLFKPFAKFIPDQVLFSMPDALWGFSLAWYLEIVWNEKNDKKLTHQIFIITLIITTGYECLQYFFKNLGWFSFYDIVWIIIALLMFKVMRIVQNDDRKIK
jgi:hypothetical protein